MIKTRRYKRRGNAPSGWEADVRVNLPGCPPIRVRRQGGTTKEAAAQWGRQCELYLIRHYAEYPYDPARGFTHDLGHVGRAEPDPGPAQPQQAAMTLDGFWPVFVQNHMVANRLRKATTTHVGNVFRRYLSPLGATRLRDIGPAEIQGIKARMSGPSKRHDRQPLAPRTVNHALTLLSTILSRAVEWGHIERAPKVRKVKVPSQDVRPQCYTDAEFEALWRAAKGDTAASLVVGLGGLAGLRTAEMLGLRWGDVDLDAGHVAVRRGIFEGDEQACKGGRARAVPMSPRLVETLRAAKGEDHEHVFPAPDGGLPRRYLVIHPLHRAQKRASLPRRGAHILRHTCGTRLADRGVPLDAIRRFLGQADLRTAQLYVHPVEGALEAAATALDRAPAWRPGGGEPPAAINPE